MKNILIIGIGGTGSNAATVLDKKIKEFGQSSAVNVTTVVFDTDIGDLNELKTPFKVAMADNASIGEICDRIGKKYIREWFPCDDKSVRNQEMFRGASQWRKKSYLAFLNAMNQPMKRKALTDALESMMKDPAGTCEVYVICSLAGGTGSGSVIPLTLYVKRYLRKVVGVNPVVRGMFALPGIFAGKQTRENAIKVYANAYGVLREINAINLVARDYNNGHQLKKNTPVRYKLGNENEPNVGVLFDSQNPEYWNPKAAPFEQIFVLDKIMGIDEPKMHDIVLANSLYSIICTDIGKQIDSEASNHEILHAQSNGSNAIFSSISSSQIRFPKDSILNYLAYKKTEDSCAEEWLVIHDEVEKEIRRIEKENRENGVKKSFAMKDYAELFERKYSEIAEKGRSPIVELINRSVYFVNESGEQKDIEKEFIKSLKSKIDKLVNEKKDEVLNSLEGQTIENKKDYEKVKRVYNSYRAIISDAYTELVDKIKANNNLFTEQLFSLEYKKFPTGTDVKKELCEEYSLIRDLLSRDKKYLHPVAAMLQLCKLKQDLKSKKETSQNIWSSISRDGKINYEADELYSLDNALVSSNSTNGHKGNNGQVHQQYKTQDSFYQSQVSADNGKHFENMDSQFKKDGAYMHSRSDARADAYYIKKDAEALVKKLFDNASTQMFYLISSRLDECVETLIKNYRSFFGRFEKERENLHELTKNALNRDSKDKGALINVFSTVESKEKIAKKIENLSGPASDEELTDRDNIVGGSVFETIYKKSVAEKNEDLVQFNDKDAKPYTSLFDSMVESYKEVIVKGDAFAEINSYNVIQAIMESVDDPAQKKALLEETFAKACGLANPQISLDKANDNEEVVQQSEITVFLMSKQTAVYIKRHTEELGIKIDDEDTDEDSLITACAKQFIAQYSKQPTVRLALANNIPDYIIYCTGEIMDISPLRIPQFNEASSGQDGLYYTNYKEAIRLGRKYDTDMWNPHLGYNLNKQCNLPYINTNVGEEKDRILVKALLSLLNEGKLVYGKQKGADETRNSFIFTDENGIEKKVYVKNSFGVYSVVDENNIAELMNWMREFEEDKLERYAKMLDERILSEMQKLPTVINENDTKNLLGKIDSINITSKKDENKTFMMLLCKRLFTIGEKEISIIDFAFKIKNSEENSNDYDDAERILKTANEIFEEIVRYRTNPEENKQLYVRTATKAYGHIYKWIAIKALKNIGSFGGLISDAEKEYASITTWMTSSGAFRVRKEEDYMREDMDNFEEYKFIKACADVPAEVVDEVLKKASQAKIDEAKKYGLIKNNSKVEDKVESIEEQTEENSEE